VSRTGRPRSHADTVNSCSVLKKRSVVAGTGLHGAAQWLSRAEVDCAATSARGSGAGRAVRKRAERRGARGARDARGEAETETEQRAGAASRAGVVDAGGATVPGARQIRGAGQGSRSESSPPDSTIDGYRLSTAAAAAIATATAAATRWWRRVGLCWGWSAVGVEQRHRERVGADWRGREQCWGFSV
jgi:hypothetical protein